MKYWPWVIVVVVLFVLSFVAMVMAGEKPKSKPESSPATITKAELDERLNTLMRERDQIIANLHAYEGAIEDCKYWLSQLESKAKLPAPTNTPK